MLVELAGLTRGHELATTHTYDVVIIGAGPAGMCAGMYAGRSMLNAVVLERGFPGGELLNTELVEDYPGFETILGHELAQKFADHAAKFGAEFKNGVGVTSVRKRADGTFETHAESGDVYESPAVIITAGGTPVKLGIPGELEYAGKGVSYCAICDGAFFRNQVIAVVGGGDAATEEADFLTRYAEKVYLIHRRDELRASKILQQRLFANPKIEVIWNTVVDSVEGDAQGLVNTLKLRNVNTDETTRSRRDGPVRLRRVPAEHRDHRRTRRSRRDGLSHHRHEHADEHSRSVRRRRRARAAHAPGDHRGRRRDDGGDRRREISQGDRRR